MPIAALLVALTSLAAAGPPAVAAFTPADAEPYFHDGAATEAAARFRLEEYGAAAQAFAAYARDNPQASDVQQAGFLAAYADLKAGAFEAAAVRFDALATSYPLLADYHRLYSARAHLAAGRPQEALARARQLPAGSALDGEARLIRAEALSAQKHPAEAAAEYRGYLEAYPTSWRASEVRYHLAEALAAAGRADEARAEFRRVYLEAPHEAWGQQAEARLGDRDFAPPELARRATALFEAMRNPESEAAWARVLAAAKLDDALACVARYHVAQSVWKQRERLRAAPLFEAAAVACAQAKDEDLTTKSLYQAGRSWAAQSDKDIVAQKRAAALFERVWREHPRHSYADDARLRQGEAWAALKDDAKVTAAWAGLPDAFPAGDQKGEALWRLAFRAWRKGDLTAALALLDKELALLPREEGWWEAGRTLYWMGRIHARRGHVDKARAAWERVVAEYPLSFYTLEALNRLREGDAPATAGLVERLCAGGDGDRPATWTFKPRALFAAPAFKRGLELARLGLGAEAQRELALAGLEPPTQKRPPPGTVVDDPDKEELLWVAAVLYDRAGLYARSHFIPRYLLTAYARAYPTGLNQKKWLLSYPRGYADLIEKNTKLTGQPAALELAIVREESAFDPTMESFANAVGLTQLTPPPAQRYANGLPHDRAALRDPAINVAIGARELGDLWSQYAGNAALAIAGYNAGAGAVNRWLRDPERKALASDEFIEAIPYDETRGYTKRVLASYLTYVWLTEAPPAARVPVLPLALPKPAKK
jgi:soluble lytic murein transglycosylase